MDVDETYLAQRRLADEREYLIRAADPAVAPKLAPFMRALRAALADGKPVKHATALAEALRRSEVAVKTGDNMLRTLARHEFVIRSGTYARTYDKRKRRWNVTDTRTVALGEWPEITVEA